VHKNKWWFLWEPTNAVFYPIHKMTIFLTTDKKFPLFLQIRSSEKALTNYQGVSQYSEQQCFNCLSRGAARDTQALEVHSGMFSLKAKTHVRRPGSPVRQAQQLCGI